MQDASSPAPKKRTLTLKSSGKEASRPPLPPDSAAQSTEEFSGKPPHPLGPLLRDHLSTPPDLPLRMHPHPTHSTHVRRDASCRVKHIHAFMHLCMHACIETFHMCRYCAYYKYMISTLRRYSTESIRACHITYYVHVAERPLYCILLLRIIPPHLHSVAF